MKELIEKYLSHDKRNSLWIERYSMQSEVRYQHRKDESEYRDDHRDDYETMRYVPDRVEWYTTRHAESKLCHKKFS